MPSTPDIYDATLAAALVSAADQAAYNATVIASLSGSIVEFIVSASNVDLASRPVSGIVSGSADPRPLLVTYGGDQAILAPGVPSRVEYRVGGVAKYGSGYDFANSIQATPAGQQSRPVQLITAPPSLPHGTTGGGGSMVVDVTGFAAAAVALSGPAYPTPQTLYPGAGNRIADVPANAIWPASAWWRIPTSDPALDLFVMYIPEHFDGLPYSSCSLAYRRLSLGTPGVFNAAATRVPGALKQYTLQFTWAAGQSASYTASLTRDGTNGYPHQEGMASRVRSRVLPWRANWRTFAQKIGVNGILPPAAVAPNTMVDTSPDLNLGVLPQSAMRFTCRYDYADKGSPGERSMLGLTNEPTAWLIARNGADGATSQAGLSYFQWADRCAQENAELPWIVTEAGKARPIDVNSADNLDLIFIMRTGSPKVDDMRGYYGSDLDYTWSATHGSSAYTVQPDTQHDVAGVAEWALLTGDPMLAWAHQRQCMSLYAANWGGSRPSALINGRRRVCSSTAGRDFAWAVKQFSYAAALAPASDTDVLWGAGYWERAVTDQLQLSAAIQAGDTNGDFQGAPFFDAVEYGAGPARFRHLLGRGYSAIVLAWMANLSNSTIRSAALPVLQTLIRKWVLAPAAVDLKGMLAAADRFATAGGTDYTSSDWAASMSDSQSTGGWSGGKVTNWGGPFNRGPATTLAEWLIESLDYAPHLLAASTLCANITQSWAEGGVTTASLKAHLETQRASLYGGYSRSRYSYGNGSNIV